MLTDLEIAQQAKILKIKDELDNTSNINETFRYIYKTLNFVNKNK